MGKWCPRCGAEYIEGWGDCSNCGVPLVDTPPERPEPVVLPAPEPSLHERGEDPFVSIWEGPTPEAGRLARLVEAAHIPVDLDEATEVGHSRIVVPRSYADEARNALEGRVAVWPSPISENPAFDFKPAFRLALVIVAFGLLVLLVLLT